MNQVNERLKKSCEDALVAFGKLKNEKHSEIQANLEWWLGSYNNDKNHVGIY